MKKNFFKKLSFVMALAMIVTALAPAAGVFAAAAPKLNAKTVYLHVAEKTTEFDFNVANKKTGWKYSWKSSNADVAEVASNGLATAVGVGTATVSVVIKDKNGEKVDTLKAKVVVRDNIKKLTITNAQAKLAVGAKNDFNRSFVTASGSKTKTSGITRWEVDKTGATIVATSGLFTATEAGTYKVTARAFQSADKYASWLADKTKYASYVTATAETTVTVAPTMVKVQQTDLDSFKVTFDSAVSDAATKLSVAQVIGTTEVVQGIKKVTMSSDNKVATVDMNTEFTQEYVYKVKYPELTDVQFTAAKVDAALVTSIEVLTKTVQDGRGTNVDVALYNKDMVNIATSTLLQRITLETSAVNSSVAGRQLFLYTKGSTTTVKATYHTYNYDTTGTETGILTASGVVSCVAWADYNLDSISSYTISTSATPSWVTVNHNVAVGDAGYKLFVKVKGTKFDGSGVEDVYSAFSGTWKFESSNINVLLVDPSTGALIPVVAGTASVVVKYNDVVVGAVPVTVVAKRAVSSVSVSTNQLTLSSTLAGDAQTVYLTVKDQFGDKLPVGSYSVEIGESTASAMEGFNKGVVTGTDYGQGQLAINAYGAAAGTYTFTLRVKDNTTQAVIPAYVTVIVQTPTVLTATSYKIEVNKSQFDTKLDPANGDITEDATFTVYGYRDGMRVTKEVINTASAQGIKYVKFEKDGSNKFNDNVSVVTTGVSTSATYHLVNSSLTSVSTSAVAITKAATGTYTIAYVDGTTGQVLASNYFTVTDTQVKPVWKLLNTLVECNNVADEVEAVKEAFDISLNGENCESDIINVEHLDNPGNQILVQKIHVKEPLNNGSLAYIEYVLDVNVTITTKQK